jgi:hypothetical protein
MNKKLVSLPIIDIDQYFDEAGNITDKQEKLLIQHFPKLRTLKQQQRHTNTRYSHTLIVLESFQKMLKGDYSSFVRLARRVSEEKYLTKGQFRVLRNLLQDLTKTPKAKQFMFLLLVTHDYGSASGDLRHFVRSSILCEKDFIKAGFSKTETKIAQLINRNHSYLGDLSLGEASVSYGYELYEHAGELGYDKDLFLKQLYMLTMLDINGAGDGYLSSRKYDQLKDTKSLKGLEKLGRTWIQARYDFLDMPKNFYEKYGNKIDSGVDFLYFQYFYYIAKQLKPGEVVDVLNICNKFRVLSNTDKLRGFDRISFSSDSDRAFHNIRDLFLQPAQEIKIITPNWGMINDIEFIITDDRYLQFIVD